MRRGELRPAVQLAITEAQATFPGHPRLTRERLGLVEVYRPVGAWGRVRYPLVAVVYGSSTDEERGE